ncbi:uncharacterized protein Pyn_41047 [Prunus yedoensis var. nudiflora]|uniref:Uncharacterized protein n=1 Tax=Prunus yedoensis var. nudiflora TaxID=2094558 RepID=A0A314UPJ5_PRUYE|nr:uncharacterized protein Pyn_41047 [Prunus yedoensis var. nudiflora]
MCNRQRILSVAKALFWHSVLDWCNLVPPSFQRVIVIYLEHPTVINVDESAVAWRERGSIARNLTAEFKQSGYEGMYDEDENDEEDGIAVDEEDEGDEGIVLEAIHVEEEGDECTIPESTNVAEDRYEGDVPLGSYVAEEGDEGAIPEGINVDEEGDEGTVPDDEQCFLEKDDRAFDNYAYHNAPDIDPAADEGEKSDDTTVSDVNSLDNSSCDEVDLPMRKRKRKLPKFEDFWPETDLNNPIFKLVFNKRKIKFSKNDKDKSYEEEHTCGTVKRNVHANSSWLAERYATQLSRIINWDVGAFKERVNEDLCVIASRSQIYKARQKAIAVSVGTCKK